MIATTWVQIVKAVLLLGGRDPARGARALASSASTRCALFARGARRSTAPGCSRRASWSTSPLEAISLGLALMFGTAGLPHILMRFYTVPDAERGAHARSSTRPASSASSTCVTFILGFGATVLVGPRGDHARSTRAATWPRRCSPRRWAAPRFLGFISAVAFATILAVVAGLTLSGAAALSHDLWVHVVQARQGRRGEQLRVARVATVVLGDRRDRPRHRLQGAERGVHGRRSRSRSPRARNFPALLLSMIWRRLHHRAARREHGDRHRRRAAADLALADGPGGHPASHAARRSR